MLKDYYLRSPTEADMLVALHDAGILVTQGNETHATCDISTVGIIYSETGRILIDGDGYEYSEVAPIDGWHVNLRVRGELTPEQLAILPIIPKPKNPRRVFAS